MTEAVKPELQRRMLYHPCTAMACGFASVLVVFAILYLAWFLIGSALRRKPWPGIASEHDDEASSRLQQTKPPLRTPAEEAEIQEGRLLLIEAVLRNPDVQAWIRRGDAQSPLESSVREIPLAPPESSAAQTAKVSALPAGKPATRDERRDLLRHNTTEPLSPMQRARTHDMDQALPSSPSVHSRRNQEQTPRQRAHRNIHEGKLHSAPTPDRTSIATYPGRDRFLRRTHDTVRHNVH